MIDVETLLTLPGRSWHRQPPASEAVIERVRRSAPGPLPEEYVALLRFSDGGEGPLALPPLLFVLYDATHVAKLNLSGDQQDLYPGHFVFGSNGGLETIAFDTRASEPWPIVMYDANAGIESDVEIAGSMAEFILAVGIEAP